MEGSTLERGQMTPLEIWRATRAGGLITAMTPGAPRGVIAPAGLPRAPRLLGRDATLDELPLALAETADAARPAAIALIGPAGAGKSALAAEVVARAGERELFPGGAVLLSCAGLSGDPGLVEALDRVARASPGPRGPGAPRALLALDHLELALDVAALLDALAGQNYAMLFTARRSLEDARIREERLAPLEMDATANLYRQTLHQLDPVRPTGEDEPLIADAALASRGSPLAVELAAALTGAMGWPLDALPASESSDARGSMDVSLQRLWEALPPWARRAAVGLAPLSGASFPRGVALAIVEAAIHYGDNGGAATMGMSVEGGEAGSAERRANVAVALDALVGLRLVGALAMGRLRMSPAIQQEAARRSGNIPEAAILAMGEAMSGWWLEYARGRAGHSGVATLVAEAPGLMGALTWARGRGRNQHLLDLAEVIGPAWREQGRLADLRLILAWSAGAARALDTPARLRATLHDLALLDASGGRLAEARAEYAEALAVATTLGDELAVAQERRGLDALDALDARAAPSAPEEA